MSKIQLTELDFSQIKENLKDYLRSTQSEFQDYDFEGSGMGIIINLLAYNTMYNAHYLNMVANEAFLDSAVFRKNVVSRAKAIGYMPTSRRSARAVVTIELIPGDAPTSITIPEGTTFSSTINGISYIFSTYETYVVTPVSGRYIITDVELIEGRRLTHRFTVDGQTLTPLSQFTLPNGGVDTSLIKVRVQRSVSDTTTEVFSLSDGINELDSESLVYFIQEEDNFRYQISFGDGVIGKALVPGNIVIVDYNVSNGAAANKAARFQATSSVGGYTNNVITVTSPAGGGSEEQSIESVKFLAPLNYQAQDRAVTPTDYKVLIKKDFPAIEAVRVWGGEENDPPQYGKVFIALKPQEGYVLSNSLKDYIVKQLVKTRNMVAIQVVIVDPDYLYLAIESTVKYRSRLTTDSLGVVKASVVQAITDFTDAHLNEFESIFRYSQLVGDIDAAHTSILNSSTEIKLKYRLYPNFGVEEKQNIKFSNAINPAKSVANVPTLTSTAFTYSGYTCYFQDDTLGTVQVYRVVDGTKVVIVSNAGTIDYETGDLSLERILIAGTPDDSEFIEFTVRPLNQDVESSRNQILVLDEDAVTVTMIDESVVR